ncbi:SEC-C motif-containing protein [Paraburkholderia sp. BL8N3]|jgi:SEC-C motif-containing protein|nr:YchJ family protein [Paraburkholderia sp. BL8N3]TCK42295.1 SEC-C motif-containing protein [Paraburkholderia sp. BL8N3]
MNAMPCPCAGASPERRQPDRAPLFAECCGRFIEGGATPSNAMELMRSRYTAYVLGDTAYLRETWSEETRPADLDASADPATRWLGLQIKRHVPLDADHAEVEFVARYKVGGRAHRLHETSRFVRNEAGRWLYVDGIVSEA